MADQFTFPSGPHVDEIPLWINFSAIPYALIKTRKEREKSNQTIAANAHVTVSVPFNGNFTNQNKVLYSSDPNEVLKLIGLVQPTDTRDARIFGLTKMLQEDVATGFLTVPSNPMSSASANIYMSVDMMDMMFLGGSRRSYNIDFNLICRSPEDSESAGAICAVLSSLCWPLLNTTGTFQRAATNGNAKLVHPDIWLISLSEKPGDFTDSSKFDNLWNDGLGPQICVLTDVNTKRVGGENSRILGINRDFPTSRQTDGNGDPTPMPLFYKITLSFTELEVSVQDQSSYSVISRSRAFFGRP